MNEVRTVSSRPTPDRLGLKLTGLFLVSLAFALLAFMAYGLLASVGEGASVTPVADQTTIIIDPSVFSRRAPENLCLPSSRPTGAPMIWRTPPKLL